MKLVSAILLSQLAFAAASCAEGATREPPATAEDASGAALPASSAQDSAVSGNIVETASAAGSFSTLVAAIKAAGLEGTLAGQGPFTVFAPTDDAFAKLPSGTVDTLLKPENKAKLASILTYHVVAGSVAAKDVVVATKLKTANGQELTVATAGGEVRIDDAKVIKTDIAATNGVIHVIDSVVLPK